MTQQIQGGAVYASLSFVDDFLRDGKLPDIHRDFGAAMDGVPADERKGMIDIGSCHGLICMRGHVMGWNPVVGMEADLPSIKVFNDSLKRPGVTIYHTSLDPLSPMFEAMVGDTVRRNNVSTITARRVLSELFSTIYGKKRGADPEQIRKSGHAFSAKVQAAGVKYLVIEGRAFSTRSTHPVPNTAAELAALGPLWEEVHRVKEAVLLRAK